MLAWSEELITDVRKPGNHGYSVHYRGELFPQITPITLAFLLHSTNQQAPDLLLLSRWWDAYRKQLGLKDFSPKSQDAVAMN